MHARTLPRREFLTAHARESPWRQRSVPRRVVVSSHACSHAAVKGGCRGVEGRTEVGYGGLGREGEDAVAGWSGGAAVGREEEGKRERKWLLLDSREWGGGEALKSQDDTAVL